GRRLPARLRLQQPLRKLQRPRCPAWVRQAPVWAADRATAPDKRAPAVEAAGALSTSERELLQHSQVDPGAKPGFIAGRDRALGEGEFSGEDIGAKLIEEVGLDRR